MNMPDLQKLIFGRLSLEAIPYHEPILVGTFIAVAIGGITAEEYAVVKRRNRLRDTVVKVDDFPFDLGAADADRPTAERKVA